MHGSTHCANKGKEHHNLKMRLLSVAIMIAFSGTAQATTVIDSSDETRTLSNDTDYLLNAGDKSNTLLMTGKSGFTFTNYGTVANIGNTNSAVRIKTNNATVVNHGTLSAENAASLVLNGNIIALSWEQVPF